MLRFSPPLGETFESASTFQVDPGGAESNVAVAQARLGLRVGWVSRVPDNALGQRVVGEIRRHGVDTSRVIWAQGERVGTYYIDLGRPPRSTNVIYDRAGSAFSRIEPGQVDWAYVRQASWLHLSGITPALGAGPRRTIEQAIQEAVSHNRVVSFDVNYRARLWTPEEAAAVLAPLLSRVTIIQGTMHAVGCPSRTIRGTEPCCDETTRAGLRVCSYFPAPPRREILSPQTSPAHLHRGLEAER
jgi:2-dehydro-3-deoxygluconokinase